VRTTLSYRITDPLKHVEFCDGIERGAKTLDNAIVFVSARTKVDDALRLERARFQESIQHRFRELAEQQGLGVTLVSSAVEVVPPLGVKDKFDGVNVADATRGEIVQKASGSTAR
jgi:hypothetical protein